jgi:hypothetical protein
MGPHWLNASEPGLVTASPVALKVVAVTALLVRQVVIMV